MKILLIDDHTLVRDGISLLLETFNLDIKVIKAANCREALTAVEEQMPDIVLLDLGLPDIPGLEGITLLREKSDVPIVVLSGTEDRDVVRQAIERGAMGFIPKTHSSDLLIGALRFVIVHKGIYLPPELILGSWQKTTEPAAKVTTPEELGLTVRQAHVLYLLLQGKSTKAIARSLGIEINTVRAHLSPVLRSLNATTRYQAISVANKIRLTFSNLPPNL